MRPNWLLICASVLIQFAGAYELGGWHYPAQSNPDWSFTQLAPGQTSLTLGDLWFQPWGSLETDSFINSTIATAMLEKKASSQGFAFYVGISMSGVGRDDVWIALLDNVTAIDTLVGNLVPFCTQYGFDGVTIDYEPSTIMPNAAQVDNLTYLLSKLGSSHNGNTSQPLVLSIDISSNLDLWETVYDLPAVSSVVDRFEVMDYYTYPSIVLPPCLQKLYTFGIRPQQVVIGVGFSSPIWSNVPYGGNPLLPGYPHVHQGWVDQNYHQIGGNANTMPGQSTWDQINDLYVAKTISFAEGDEIFYLWWPVAGNVSSELVSVTFWNPLSSLQSYCDFVRNENLLGLFSWTTASDTPRAFASEYLATCLTSPLVSSAAAAMPRPSVFWDV